MNINLLQCELLGTRHNDHQSNPALNFLSAEFKITNLDYKDHGGLSLGVCLPELKIGAYKFKQCETEPGYNSIDAWTKFPMQTTQVFPVTFQIPAVLRTEVYKIRLPNGCWSDPMQMILDPTTQVDLTNVFTEKPKGEHNAEMYAKAQQVTKEADASAAGAIALSLFCPGLAMFAVGKVFQRLCCLGLQLTGLGWIPATIWAIVTISMDKSEKQKQAALLERMAIT
jgi:uncharacterized membrane protein YqaE (UPF0057 family)